MDDAINPTAAAAHDSDAKEALADAIAMARRLGKPEAVERLEARLAHTKAVFPLAVRLTAETAVPLLRHPPRKRGAQ
jgi:hypothetical protein